MDNRHGSRGPAVPWRGALLVCVLLLCWSHASGAVWFVDGQADSLLGHSATSAGDVNGDGYADVIIGAYGGSNPRVVVYKGSAGGLPTVPDWIVYPEQSDSLFGANVAGAGDVNGDGFADVLVGAQGYQVNGYYVGRVSLYLGSAAGLGTMPAWAVTGPGTSQTEFGRVFGTAGDVNGDGYADVIVSAPEYHNGSGSLVGRVWLYPGSASGPAPAPTWTLEGGNPDAEELGSSLSAAGDVDGDGYDDVVIGGRVYLNGNHYGRAFVVKGSPTGLANGFASILQGSQSISDFGRSVSTAGDVNGDGYADVIVGAPEYSLSGRVYLYLGSATGLQTVASWTATAEQDNAHFGFAVGAAGDVNGDGYSDVIDGAHRNRYETVPANPYGRALVYHGGPGGLSVGPSWIGQSDQTETYYGYSVATAGDVDDDGYSDVLVGAFNYNQGSGRAYVQGGSEIGLGVFPGAGEAGSTSLPLTVTKPSNFQLRLAWGASCSASDQDYAVYEGTMGYYSSYVPIVCSTGGATSWTFMRPPGNRYYLVVPHNEVHEGSYGRDSQGHERAQSPYYCRAQQIAPCP